MTNNSILKQLQIKEKFEKRTLKRYEDILYRTFQIIYEVDAIVEWERIFRFSPTSNFVILAGTALISKGQELANGNILPEDIELDISLTIPWNMLEDGSTGYEIADVAKAIGTVRSILPAKQFHDMLRDGKVGISDILGLLPDTTKSKKLPDMENVKLPSHLEGFNFDELTDKQKQSLMLSEVIKK